MKYFQFLIVICASFVCPRMVLAQTIEATAQTMLDNDSVRVVRVVLPPGATFTPESTGDLVILRVQDETAEFIPKGARTSLQNSTDRESVELLIQPKRHWDVAMRPCSEPLTCTRTTKMSGEPVAWTTTLFTNGFLTGAKHKVVRGGTLNSSYYSAKGTDAIVVVPFTDLKANFGGIEETLKAGQPYFSSATEAEVSGADAEARWFVLRLNNPKK